MIKTLIRKLFPKRFDNATAVIALLHEAAGQKYEVLLAVACAARNRGEFPTPMMKMTSVQMEAALNVPIWQLKMADKAWHRSAEKDVIDGCTEWDNTKFYHVNCFRRDLEMYKKIDDFEFYRRVR